MYQETIIWLRFKLPTQLVTLIKTLKKYMNEITNYFLERNSSGFVEGFNNKIKVLTRRSYGLRSAGRLFQRLKLDTEGLGMFRFSGAF